MPNRTSLMYAVSIMLLAVFYQYFLKDLLFVSLGLFRRLQHMEDFHYTCRPIRHEKLEGCEDIWLDEEKRTLYAACGNSYSRCQWCPSMNRFNISGRRPGGDYVSVLNIDRPDDVGIYQLEPIAYLAGSGNRELYLHGFDVEIVNETQLRFWMINHQPPAEEEDNGRTLADAYRLGANSTIEIFDCVRGGIEMHHVQTMADKAVDTPNNLAITGHEGVLVINDHSGKVGLRRMLDPFIGGGSVAYCTLSTCHLTVSSGFNHPNGIVKRKDGLYFISSSFINRIRVMKLETDLTLSEVHVIHVGMPIDNLSVDHVGDIYAAAFPKILDVGTAFNDPYGTYFPSTIWRLRRLGSELNYEVTKILEDGLGDVIQGATVARHDSKTGKLFIGGNNSKEAWLSYTLEAKHC